MKDHSCHFLHPLYHHLSLSRVLLPLPVKRTPPKFEIITRPYKFIISIQCADLTTESGLNGHKKLNNSYPNIPG